MPDKVGHPELGAPRVVKGREVNKTQLIDALSTRFEGNKKAAAHALESVLDTITREVAKGEKVAITGFGSFEKKVRDARWVRNPRTGERMKAKKTAVPKFTPGQDLKNVISGAKKLPKLTVAKAGSAASAAAAPAAKAASAVKKAAPAKSAPAKKATATKAPAKSAAPAKKTPAKKTPAKKASATTTTAAKKAPAKKTTTATKKAPAKKAPAKKTASSS